MDYPYTAYSSLHSFHIRKGHLVIPYIRTRMSLSRTIIKLFAKQFSL
jgi:hypothetical protein